MVSKHLDILSNLFGSMARVKLLKFFLMNQDMPFSVEDIATRLRMKPRAVKEDLQDLARSGFIKKKIIVQVVKKKRSVAKKKVNGFAADKSFSLESALRNLLIESGGTHLPDLSARLHRVGKIKLLVVSGIFLKDDHRTLDIMIVGDRLNRKKIESEIKKIESEIGKELRYAVFDTPEFGYRLKMYDKLLRDIFDYPHHKLINKMDNPELSNGFA